MSSTTGFRRPHLAHEGHRRPALAFLLRRGLRLFRLLLGRRGGARSRGRFRPGGARLCLALALLASLAGLALAFPIPGLLAPAAFIGLLLLLLLLLLALPTFTRLNGRGGGGNTG